MPFEHEPNRGFLRALHALARAAQSIGEQEEYERCTTFLRDTSPTAADDPVADGPHAVRAACRACSGASPLLARAVTGPPGI